MPLRVNEGEIHLAIQLKVSEDFNSALIKVMVEEDRTLANIVRRALKMYIHYEDSVLASRPGARQPKET